MALLPAVGTASYNGYEFGPATHTTGIEIRPVQDAAGRTIVYSTFTITLQTDITSSNPGNLDANVKDAIAKLTKQGGKLVFTSRGAGGLHINTGLVKDVVWGPVPKLVSVKPLGGGCACQLTWQVEVHLPTCTDARYEFAPMEFCFRVNFDVDRSGYTTRTYSGFVRVPMTRRNVNSRTIPDSADYYREKITPPFVPGFRRVPGSFTIDESKTRLDFSIVDEQMPPQAPPPGVIDVQADHTIQNPPGKLRFWTCTLNATYELARGVPASVARDHFLDVLARDRVRTTQRELKGRAVVPVQFTMSEPQIYGRAQAKFSLTYTVSGPGLREMLRAGGMWRPVPGSDWRRWATSMAAPLGPRGTARLVFTPNEDTIIDLCRPAPAVTPSQVRELRQVNGLHLLPEDVFPKPTPDDSWLHPYANVLRYEADSGTVLVKTLPDKPLSAVPNFPGPWSAELNKFPAGTGANAPPLPFGNVVGLIENETGTSIQQRTTPTVFVIMTGHAMRHGFPVPCPALLKVEGMVPVLCNRVDRGEGFWTGIVGSSTAPVYGARWNLRYALPRMPNGPLPVPPNPLEGS